jgi:glyoxylase-like metal-dependent hydrolase (beta-lactamase superfamily II)/predicted ester cyclase
MASSSETARAYFAALADRDVDGAVALWSSGGVDHITGQPDLSGPEAVRSFLEDLFGALPDLRFEIIETTTHRERCVVRWRARGTFAGPRRLDGFVPNGRRFDCEGCDVLTIRDAKVLANHVYMDTADMYRQLGLLPRSDSAAHRRASAVANHRRARRRLASGGEAKVIAPGVWLVSRSLPSSMNVYLLAEPDGGVTVFDAGVRAMTPAIASAGARLGGIRRVVLGHADCDHRGGAAGLGVPVYCHPEEVQAAQSPASRRDYWDLSKLSAAVRPLYPAFFRGWDGGALEVAGTVEEGTEVAGFRVVDLPGHAPGLIGLFREEDGLAICSDVLYTLNVETGMPGGARVPHPAFNQDTELARQSLLKLADLAPRVVWVGHSHPVSGPEVPDQLRRAAGA